MMDSLWFYRKNLRVFFPNYVRNLCKNPPIVFLGKIRLLAVFSERLFGSNLWKLKKQSIAL